MIGRTLSHYRILEKLGAGGMGEVYRAEDTSLKRQVALKVLPSELASSRDLLERFQREAETLARLDHPNIVTVYSVEEADGVHFLTMQLVEGKRLADLIPPGGFPLERIFELAIPLADALASAHEKGIIHRDLKPANIMVGDDGRVEVLDFGLAKLRPDLQARDFTTLPTEGLTAEGQTLGTVPYMSPEQVRGEQVDPRSDIFSLGVVLYEMATGRRPFQGDSSAELASSILRDRPPLVTQLHDELPHHLGRVIHHCLEKDPEKRIQTAKDVRNELEGLKNEVTSGTLPTSGPITPPPTSPTPARRRLLPVGIGLGVVALLLVGVLWLLHGREEAARESRPPSTRPPETRPERRMIAVLPFENLGAADDAYFAAGITEEISGRLAVVSGLGVISRKSAQRYAESEKTIPEIGSELGVDYILEGTVRWARSPDNTSRVRITPQLIGVADDLQLWSNTYDRVIDDIFEVQSDIATQVIRQLDVALLGRERQTIEAKPTDNLEAYQLYLRGLDHARQPDLTQRQAQLATDMFLRAVELDPDFAQAHAQLSLAHARLYWFGVDASEKRLVQARAAADRALRLDPDLGEGYLALGYVHYYGGRDYEAALAEFRRAEGLLPGSVDVAAAMGYVYRRQGRFEEAAASFLRALELDPGDGKMAAEVADAYIYLRRHQEADRYYDRSISLQPDQIAAYGGKAANLWRWKGDAPGARAILQRMPEHRSTAAVYNWVLREAEFGDFASALARLEAAPFGFFDTSPIAVFPKAMLEGWIYDLMGERERAAAAFGEALPHLERYARDEPENAFAHSGLALALSGVGRHQQAIREVELAAEMMPPARDAIYAPYIIGHAAVVYRRAGDFETAIDRLETLLSLPYFVTATELRLHPDWAPLRDLPRFQALLEKYG